MQRMRDVAAETDERGITIDRVGVRDIHLPVMIREKDGGMARVVGRFDVSVQLPHHERGTHMSRFVEILSRWSKKAVALAEIREMLAEIRTSFDAEAAQLSLQFKYFLGKRAPATGLPCQLDYDCLFTGQMRGDDYTFTLGVTVPLMTMCPCSKELSDRGAHSQRAELTARLRSADGFIMWLEDLVPLLEAQGSSEVFPMLKRADEKMVTEQAYDNPKFVEDVVRDTVLVLRQLAGVAWFSVECKSHESIHKHIAYAYAESDGQ